MGVTATEDGKNARERGEAMREVRIIPAIREFASGQGVDQLRPKRKVAGYARVSTDRDDQFTSYEAQVDYYTTMIKANADWQFVGIYTDEGISGTSTARREGFKQMITDALAGKIDLIVTKSVSRFARNTVDSLTTIRSLKESKVEVFFEKEGIWTFDSKGELLITIMSSLAQEESRSISENVKWGRRKRFADGQISVPYTRFLGYDKGVDGNLVINPEQAKIIRYIYALFLQGLSIHAIAKQLENNGYKTVTGKSTWHPSSIKYILTNEKYKGDALLQKYFIDDFLTKRPIVNNGEVAQYYVESNHEAIISRDIFDLVQQEIEHRKHHVETTKGSSLFSGRLTCGVCEGTFGSKVWHSNDKYRKVIWQCNDKYKHKDNTCTSPHLSEDELKERFMKAVNQLIENKVRIIRSFEEIKDEVFDASKEEEDMECLKQERTKIVNLMERLTRDNALVAMDQETYKTQFEGLLGRYHSVNEQLVVLEDTIRDKQYRKNKTELFLKTLKKQEGLVTEFSEKLWNSLAGHAVIYSKEDVRFTFRNGVEIQA
jgi:DNA invertase Pin-like site-specific DNA recombinase